MAPGAPCPAGSRAARGASPLPSVVRLHRKLRRGPGSLRPPRSPDGRTAVTASPPALAAAPLASRGRTALGLAISPQTVARRRRPARHEPLPPQAERGPSASRRIHPISTQSRAPRKLSFYVWKTASDAESATSGWRASEEPPEGRSVRTWLQAALGSLGDTPVGAPGGAHTTSRTENMPVTDSAGGLPSFLTDGCWV